MASQYDFYDDDDMLSYQDYSASSTYNDCSSSTKPDTSTEKSSASLNDDSLSTASSYDSFVIALMGKYATECTRSSEGDEKRPRMTQNNVSNESIFDFSAYVDELSMKEPFDIIKDIRASHFNADVIFDWISKNPSCLLSFMKIVRIICLSKYAAHRIEILYRICRPRLVSYIREYLKRCAQVTHPLFFRNFHLFVNDLIEFYTSVVNLLPELAIELNFKELIVETITAEGISCKFRASNSANVGYVNARLEKLSRILDNAVTEIESAPVTVSADGLTMANFRTTSLYPTREDLINQTASQMNKIKGAFGSVEQYLGIQFGLIRENAIRPIHQGFQAYRNGSHSYDLRFYVNARFADAGFRDKTFYYEVKLNDNRLPNNSNNSVVSKNHVLSSDSLLLFTNNDFATFFFANVLEYNAAERKLLVTMKGSEMPIGIFNSTYTMVDTGVPYDKNRRIMKALRSFDESNFPLPRSLVNIEINTMRPNYLRLLDPGCHLRQLINSPVHKDWSLNNLTLNEHQLVALRAALSNDLTLIRGYPRTGKTHIASMMVKVLVQEIESYPANVQAPILMICSSDRALDQFLESILKYTRAIVRVGGQPCRPALAPYNLRDISSPVLGNGMAIATLKSEIVHWRRKTTSVVAKIREINKFEGILSYDVLKTAMDDRHREVLNGNEKLLTWLLNEDETYDADVDEEQCIRWADVETATRTEISKKEKIAERLGKGAALHPSSNRNNLKKEPFEKRTFIAGDRDNFVIDIGMPQTNVSVYMLTIAKLTKEYVAKVERMKVVLQNFADSSGIDRRVLYFALENAKMARQKLLNVEQRVKKIATLQKMENMYEQLANNANDINSMCREDRWWLYAFWISRLRKELAETLVRNEREYMNRLDKYEKEADLRVMAGALVIGVTSACASKLQNRFKALQPAIVIVEEATDIMEPELVISLTHNVEHLILIGDPNSMKQSTEISKYSKINGADISLFERLMNNGMKCYPLLMQYNVRPDISALVSVLCNSELQNREIVDYEIIPGFAKSVFFIDYCHLEENVEEIYMKNTFEAKFIQKLCIFLLYQGYSVNAITVLTFYPEQMCLMRKFFKDAPKSNSLDYLLNNVLITTVDKYRNQTNDIVLLSLVNSNNEENIGLLKEKSSIYTSLTRAQKGLYIIGNMRCLTKYSSYWTLIKKILEERNAIGSQIKLFCKHHNTYWHVARPNDKWEGCYSICNKKLLCGHDCKYPCHLNDERHNGLYKCKETCSRKCLLGHECTLPCSESCKTCPVMIETLSHVCGHTVTKQCGAQYSEAVCPEPCGQILSCGHACASRCHKFDDPNHKKYKCQELCGVVHKDCMKGHKCTKFCWERCNICLKIEWFILECGHRVQLPCSSIMDKIKCYETCLKICESCGFQCKKKCYETCEPCLNVIKKTFEECGHEIMVECSVTLDSSLCKTSVTLDNVLSLCGHNGSIVVPCGLINEDRKYLLTYCNEPCRATLKCGHLCTGTCGFCLQGRLHKVCKQKCERVLICGHRCSSLCDEMCPPCSQPCTYYCKHNKCQIECGLPCSPCKEKCDWGCKHSVCTRKCGEICNRYPCYELCELELKCGHQCFGLCGDPCPSCRICDSNKLESVNGVSVRFILLEDCNHAIESRILDMHLSDTSVTNLFKKCPIPSCQQLIVNTLRYKNCVKMSYRYLNNMKQNYFTFDEQTTEWKKEMNEKLSKIWEIYYFETEMDKISEIECYFQTVIGDKGNFLLKQQMKAMDFYINVMLDIGARSYDFGGVVNVGLRYHNLSGLIDIKCFPLHDEIRFCLGNILRRLEPMSLKLNYQIIQDVTFELNRFHRFVDLSILLDSPQFKDNGEEPRAVEIRSSIQKILYGYRIYTDDENNKVKALLRDLTVFLKQPKPLVLRLLPPTEINNLHEENNIGLPA